MPPNQLDQLTRLDALHRAQPLGVGQRQRHGQRGGAARDEPRARAGLGARVPGVDDGAQQAEGAHRHHQAHHRQQRAQPVAEGVLQQQAEEEHRGRQAGQAARSSTSTPFSRCTSRRARAAALGSWVTITMVLPSSCDQLLQQRQHLLAGGAVEVAGGLVGDDQRRVGDQRARDGHALLLAARELARVGGRRGRSGPPAPAPAPRARAAGAPTGPSAAAAAPRSRTPTAPASGCRTER